MLAENFTNQIEDNNENKANISTGKQKIIASRLKELRKDRNKEDPNNKWTQEYVAKLLGISRSAYALYEIGDNNPPVEVLLKLSEIYGGVSIDYIFGRQDDKSVSTDILVDPEIKKMITLLNRLPEDKREKLIYMLYGALMNEEL